MFLFLLQKHKEFTLFLYGSAFKHLTILNRESGKYSKKLERQGQQSENSVTQNLSASLLWV